jgi:isocitrate/isopropylmalate dehydrogenase
MVVRELTGGVYFGEPKQIIDLGNGQKRAIDTQDYHTYEIERIGRVAFELAGQRRNKVPSSDERNVMKSGVLWDEVINRFARAGISRWRAFCNLKQYRRIGTRYDKTDQRFKGMINLAAIAIALK